MNNIKIKIKVHPFEFLDVFERFPSYSKKLIWRGWKGASEVVLAGRITHGYPWHAKYRRTAHGPIYSLKNVEVEKTETERMNEIFYLPALCASIWSKLNGFAVCTVYTHTQPNIIMW